MKRYGFAFFFTILCLSLPGMSQGFSSGNQFSLVSLEGRLQVECTAAQVVLVDCSDAYLKPGEYDYFVGPSSIDADQVELTATHENGKTVKKSSNYKNGKSTSSFNLSINTFFQRALLDMGENKIQFVLKNRGAVVSNGDFVAVVKQGPKYTCPDGYIDSFDDSFCNSYNRACDRYFAEHHQCQ